MILDLDTGRGPVDDGVEHGVDDGEQLGDPGEVVEGLAHIELPLPQGRHPLDDVEQEPWAPAHREYQDDHQQHLDDLLPALVNLVRLVDRVLVLVHDEDSLTRCPSLVLINSLRERG